jgi:hypothetical protein
LRKRRDVIPPGKIERGERKQTVDEVSKAFRRCQNRGLALPPGSTRGNPEACPSGIRHVGGAKFNQALVRNVRTCASMERERSQAAQTVRIRVPMRSIGTEQLVVVMKVL